MGHLSKRAGRSGGAVKADAADLYTELMLVDGERRLSRAEVELPEAVAILDSLFANDDRSLLVDVSVLVPSAGPDEVRRLANAFRAVLVFSKMRAAADQGRKGRAAVPSRNGAAKADVIREWNAKKAEPGMTKSKFANSAAVAEICKGHGVKVEERTIEAKWLGPESIAAFEAGQA